MSFRDIVWAPASLAARLGFVNYRRVFFMFCGLVLLASNMVIHGFSTKCLGTRFLGGQVRFRQLLASFFMFCGLVLLAANMAIGETRGPSGEEI